MRKRIRKHSARMRSQATNRSHQYDALEPRQLLASTLFVDFGFGFTGGTLAIDNTDIATVNGPQVFPGATKHVITSFTSDLNSLDAQYGGIFDTDSNGTVSSGEAQTLANSIIAVANRMLTPFDVTIQQNNAADLAGISTGVFSTTTDDAYLIAAGTSDQDIGCGAGGMSSCNSFGFAPYDVNNSRDDTGFAFLRQIGNGLTITALNSSNPLEYVARMFARTIVHEAGHTWGLDHLDGQTSELRTRGSTMAAPGTDSMGNSIGDNRVFGQDFHLFTRFTLPTQVSNGVNVGTGTENSFDLMAANVGLKANTPFYVTGTGASDRITISNAGSGNVNIVVQPFTDQSFSTTFGAATTFLNTPLPNGLLVEAGFGTDRVFIGNNVSATIEVRGGDDLAIFNPGQDLVAGPNQINNWNINGSFAGTLNSNVTFSETRALLGNNQVDTFTVSGAGLINALNGLAGNDVFQFNGGTVDGLAIGGTGDDVFNFSGGVVTGSVTGDEGFDQLGFAGTFAQTVNLMGPGAIDGFSGFLPGATLGGFSDINQITGSSGTGDVIIGMNLDAQWQVTDTIDTYEAGGGSIELDDFEALIGGSSTDHFEIAAGIIAKTVNGGGGTNTIAGPDVDRTWNLDGIQQGSLVESVIPFFSIQEIQSGTAVDTFNVSSTGSMISIVDTGGVDVIAGPDLVTQWNIGGVDAGQIPASIIDWNGVESLTGGSASDTFVFEDGGRQSGFVNGSGGYDYLDYRSRIAPANLRVVVQGASGFTGRESSIGQTWRNMEHMRGSAVSIVDKITGINTDSHWHYTPTTSTYSADSSAEVFTFESVEQLFGNRRIDSFLIAPPTADRIIVNGGLPTTAPGDTLELDFTGVSGANWIYTGPGDGTFTFANRENVIYRSIETLDVFDRGDAAATFGTLDADDGARHRLGTPLRFGTGIDPEADGQPSALADGDDLNGSSDDEDGVILPAYLIPHFRAAALVQSSGTAKLDAWIDLNGDGVFSVDEKIADSVDVVAGSNRIEFFVPYGTTMTGETTARFRLSSAGELSPLGIAEDGEVEDHAISIADVSEGTYAVLPDPLSPGNQANRILVMAGTSSGDDVIVVNPTSSGDLRVRINGMSVGPDVTEPVKRIGSYGLNGDDTIIVTSTMTQQSELYGDSGSDDLFGGASADYLRGGVGDDRLYGHQGRDLMFGEGGDDLLYGHGGADILSGNTGNDRLFGGFGNDLLFGGGGADWMYGQGGSDLMIGNGSVYDNVDASLELFRDEWSSRRGYNAKVNNVNNGTGPILGPAGLLLDSGTTVMDDGEYDRYFGGRGRDAFISVFGPDNIFGADPDEEIR